MHQLSSVTALYALALSQMLSHPIPSAASGFVTSSVGQGEFCRELEAHGMSGGLGKHRGFLCGAGGLKCKQHWACSLGQGN